MPIDEYQEFSESQLKFGYWFTKHRELIKAILLSFGFLIFGGLLVYNVKNIIDYYALGEVEQIQQQILTTPLLSGDALERYNPRALQWQPVQVITRGEGEGYDIFAEVTNPNQKHVMEEMEIYFQIGTWKSVTQEVYVLPIQRKLVFQANIQDPTAVSLLDSGIVPKVVVEREQWRRVRDISLYENGRFRGDGLVFQNVNTRQIGASSRELIFEVYNNSPYNYRASEVRVVLYDGTKPVALGYQKLSNIHSNTSQEVIMRWFYPLPVVTNWRIDFSTNILDSDIITPFTIEQFE